MKKWLIPFLILILWIVPSAYCEEDSSWAAAPQITKAYELSEGKLYLEWEGSAPVYQVYMDGKSVADVIVNSAVISVEKGTHAIHVYPISEAKSADTKIELGVEGDLKVLPSMGANLSLDLAALGLDPQKLVAGTPSAPLNIDYTPGTIFDAVPDQLTATTDFDNRILLSFSDRYHADEYLISVKTGKDINYIRFNYALDESAALISKIGNIVTIALEPDYLQRHECMVPELDEKYTFTVQLRKYAKNMLSGENIITVIYDSKESKSLQYTPEAAWKVAPVITYASQTSDGQITLEWTHNDNNLGCEYAIMKIVKKLGIKTGEEKLGATTDHQFIINDLMNDKYALAIIPQYNNEKGHLSEDVTIEIQNDWVVAPALTCEQSEQNQVKLFWNATDGVESYHITVHAGNNESLLRFIDLDFKQYAEYDIPATGDQMEYTFTYNEEIPEEAGIKLKFEIYGIRHAADDTEQKTATSSQIITLQ